MELYKLYRPTKFSEVIGQKEAVSILSDMGKRNELPHTILFTGPSGTGKTTLARILRNKLKCADVDFFEKNAADDRGIEMVREIRSRIGTSPIGGSCRIWLIDECHQLTSQAQESFLNILEDTPSHVYFFLATTDPQKLKPTIRTRCTQINCKVISDKELGKLVSDVYQKEKDEPIPTALTEKIVEHSDGSARKALVLLHAVIGIEDLDAQLQAIESEQVVKQSIEIARALLGNTKWIKMSEILKAVDEDPESIRRMVLGYCNSILLKGAAGATMKRAVIVMEEFREAFYDTGKPGLTLACYNAINQVT